MSNKSLFLILCVIVVVGAAIGGYFYWLNTKPLVISPPIQLPGVNQAANSQPVATSTPPAAQPAATSTAQAPAPSGQCEKDFSPSKLAANSGINIQNREVEINVANYGKIDLAFYDQDAPNTVRNFLRLVDSGFYDCLTFHRVAAGFVIQGGDPSGNGSGGVTASGQPLIDELNPNAPSYKTGYTAGILAMAETSAPNTGTSQFFITLADDNSVLQKNYPIFGHVISGMDVVTKIGLLQTNPPGDGMPVTPVIMTSVKIIK